VRRVLIALALGLSAPALAQETHEGMSHDAPETEPVEGATPAPEAPTDHAADAVYDPAEMAKARAALRHENGGLQHDFIGFDLAEYQARKGRDGYRWEGEAWFGGDVDRMTLKYEGEGAVGGKLEDTEFQALWSHAVDPWWNVQAGVRHDVRPSPQRTYGVVGIEGIAPYWFKLSGTLFVSNKGDVHLRAEGHYDQRITERLILQPRFEANFAAQRVAEIGLGSGLNDFELGLRMRYEIKREFAPYIGVEWSTKAGGTARLARLAGEDPSSVNFVLGASFWF
jgi:copper resistance protein B